MEAWAVEQAGRLLDRRGLAWTAGRYVPGIGDIDLEVRGNKSTVVVEIKSFNRWHQSLLRLGHRERKAIEQVKRQTEAVGADVAVIWLPRGTPTLWQRILGAGAGQVRVLFGSPSCLARKLRKV